MLNINLDTITRVHFVGVGGIGMSGLARLFLHDGKEVSGSDRTPSAITSAIEEEGLHFFGAQTAENITRDIELVIYTEAMSEDHPELLAARAAGIPCINYFEGLGLVANEYYLVAVAGAHGKTTTTAVIIDALEDAGFDPSGIVGSLRGRTGRNYRAGKSKYFVVEACEYKRDFLTLTPDVLVITNIEHEHVDYYKDLEDVQRAFHELGEQVREGGVIIAPCNDPLVMPALKGLSVTCIDYTKNFNPDREMSQPGIHNQMNGAAAYTAAEHLGVSGEVVDETLRTFTGTWRRFEYKGTVNGAPVYDDYGHHPTEIRATVQAVREKYPDKRVVLAFQPHTYSRTAELFDGFVDALRGADRILLAPIYAAREENIHDVSSTGLAQAVGDTAEAYEAFDMMAETLRETLTDTDVLLIMGAGDITKLTTLLL